MPVDRCICHAVEFTALKAIALREHCGLVELARQTGCGTGCGLCVPYVRLMLKSGRTSFPVMSPRQFEQVLGPHCCRFDEAAAIRLLREAPNESGPLTAQRPA